MCDFTEGFRLCSCQENGLLEGYVWQLRTKKEKLDWMEMKLGKCILPSLDIENGLAYEWVKLNLEDHNCFDFEYSPSQGDNLIVFHTNNRQKYLSLIYKDGEWIGDFYDELGEMSELQFQGVVQRSMNEENK